MPVPVTPIPAQRRGEAVVLQWAPPGGPLHKIGVLLLDPVSDRLFVRLRDHWDDIANPEDVELLAVLEEDFHGKAREMGGESFLRLLEDCLSHTLRIDNRETVALESFTLALDRLYERHVEKLKVLPFRSHLPLYSLRAAATKFGEDQAVEEEAWVRAPEGMRLDSNMFVAHVVGRSMEPRIPDGSLNVFRSPVVGSRQNKLLLVEVFGQLEDSARYTVKKYTSRKVYRSEDEWEHGSIRLEPLNPEFESFELRDGEFRAVAEWVRTLE